MEEQTTTGASVNDKKSRVVIALGQLAVAYLFFLRANDMARASSVLSAFRQIYNTHAADYAAHARAIGLVGGSWRPPSVLNASKDGSFDAATRETIALSILFFVNRGGAYGSQTVSVLNAFPGPGQSFNLWFDQQFMPLLSRNAKSDVAFFRMYETLVRTMESGQVLGYLVQKAENAINNDPNQPIVTSPKPQPAIPSTQPSPSSSLPAPIPPRDEVTILDADNPLLVEGRVAKPAIPWALIGIGAGLAIATGVIVWGLARNKKKGSKSNDNEI